MLKVRNNYKTKLTKSITASATELQIDRAPSPIMTLSNSDDHFLLVLTNEETGDYEVIKCVGIIGRIITVGITLNTPNINGRGYDNTTALVIDKDADHTLRMVVTSSALDEFLDNLTAIDASFTIASTAEAEAGENDEHVLSSLKGVEMFEAYAPLASQIQAETGTDNITRMTPLREKQGLDYYFEENLPFGTLMFFRQNVVPTNWVFDSAHSDRLILNTSTQSEGGETGGSWTFSGISVNGHAVTLTEFPIHKHGINVRNHESNNPGTIRNADWGGTNQDTETKPAGGGLEHSHGITSEDTWRPAYTKLISCSYAERVTTDTVLLIQSDTTNGSQVFVDHGVHAHELNYTSVTYDGLIHPRHTDQFFYYLDSTTPMIAPTTPKFGKTSFALSRSSSAERGSKLIISDNLEDFDIIRGSFTIDFWIIFESVNEDTFYPIAAMWDEAGIKNWYLMVRLNNATSGYFNFCAYDTPNAQNAYSKQTSFWESGDKWTHVAITCDGSILYFFIDGVLTDSHDISTLIPTSTVVSDLHIGGWEDHPPVPWWYAAERTPFYFDEFRIRKGTAVWTTDFTPPTAPVSP